MQDHEYPAKLYHEEQLVHRAHIKSRIAPTYKITDRPDMRNHEQPRRAKSQ